MILKTLSSQFQLQANQPPADSVLSFRKSFARAGTTVRNLCNRAFALRKFSVFSFQFSVYPALARAAAAVAVMAGAASCVFAQQPANLWEDTIYTAHGQFQGEQYGQAGLSFLMTLDSSQTAIAIGERGGSSWILNRYRLERRLFILPPIKGQFLVILIIIPILIIFLLAIPF